MTSNSFPDASWTALAERSGDSTLSARKTILEKTVPARWKAAARSASRRGPRRSVFAGNWVMILALVVPTFFLRAATNDSFADGATAVQAGNFSEAATTFENIAKQNPSSGAFVNLGLAEWQRGHAGAAILAWERAVWIDPFDERANQNLNFARQVAQVDAPPLKWFETASTWLPPDAWVWIAGASLWLAIGALVLPRCFRRRKSSWQQTLAALGLGLFILALTANAGVVSRTDIGIVQQKNTPLLLTPTHTSEVLSTLPAGESARKIKSRGNFYFIRTTESSGWVARENFRLVAEN